MTKYWQSRGVLMELSRKGRQVNLLKILKERKWPGTESNCRHEDFQSSALPTELPGHEGKISSKTGTESRSRYSPLRAAVQFKGFLLDKINHLAFELNTIERVNLLYARRTRYIDLGQIVSDDIEPYEIEPVLSQ